MWKTFYSPAELLRKPHVVPSLIVSVCIVVVLITGIGLWLNRNMIYVRPIAEASSSSGGMYFVSQSAGSWRTAGCVQAFGRSVSLHGNQLLVEGHRDSR